MCFWEREQTSWDSQLPTSYTICCRYHVCLGFIPCFILFVWLQIEESVDLLIQKLSWTCIHHQSECDGINLMIRFNIVSSWEVLPELWPKPPGLCIWVFYTFIARFSKIWLVVMCVLVFKSKCNGIKPFENLNLIEADIFSQTFTLILGFIATSFGRKLILYSACIFKCYRQKKCAKEK